MKRNLVDRAEFTATAGWGGNGAIHFRREKYVARGGPDGGDGGAGGSVILRASRHVATLRFFAGKDRFEARKGYGGQGRQKAGEDAPDLVLEVPVGTVVKVQEEGSRLLKGRKLYGEDVERMVESGYKVDRVAYIDFYERWNIGNDKLQITNDKQNPKSKIQSAKQITNDQFSSNKQFPNSKFQIPDSSTWVEVGDLDVDGEEMVLARGGRGGLGNVAYKSSRNTTPKVAQRGELGERFEVRLTLKVLADVGLVGLPNAGKSTLLSVLTAARPEIANYPFTTLSPNLGVMNGGTKSTRSTKGTRGDVVIADIPGLIEDAHKGKGLGVDFLRHVERCRVLVYVLAPTMDGIPDRLARNTRQAVEDDKSGMNSFPDLSIEERLWGQYLTVKKEVESYGRGLLEKPCLVVINKRDLLDESQESGVRSQFKKHGVDVSLVSAATTVGIEGLKEKLVSLGR